MSVLKIVGGNLFCALVAGGTGGATGLLVTLFAPLISNAALEGANLAGITMAASMMLLFAIGLSLYAIPIGAVIGFVPALATGLILSALVRWEIFRTPLIWMLSGAATGFGVSRWLNSDGPLGSPLAWTIGGATGMLSYWALSLRIFRLRRVSFDRT